MATRTVHAMALRPLQAPPPDEPAWAWYGNELAAAKKLTDRYLAAWSGRDGAAVGRLYAENATMVDSLLGVRLIGRGAIGSYAAEHGGAALRQDSIPDGGARRSTASGASTSAT